MVAGDEIHNSMNNLQDSAPLLLGAGDYSRDTNELSLQPCSSLPTGEMESFARSLFLRLSLKRSSFQGAADNHTYSMCWQAINLSRYFIFQSFIYHPGSWMEHRLLHNISN